MQIVPLDGAWKVCDAPLSLAGLNAKKSRWPEQRSWWYVTTFTVSASFLRHERQQLIFDGLDLYAKVIAFFARELPKRLRFQTIDPRHAQCC